MERDMSPLSHDTRDAARIDPSGEVSWPVDSAGSAISELASAGLVVLGLDVRFYDSEGRFSEIPWSSHGPDRSRSVADNAEAARIVALDRLAKIDDLEAPEDTVERRLLITWE